MNGAGQDDEGAATQPEDVGATGASLDDGPESPKVDASESAPQVESAASSPREPAEAGVASAPATDAAGGNGAAPEAVPAATPEVAPAQIVVRFAGRSVVGLVREHNEDNFIIANLESGDRHPRDATCVDEVGKSGIMFTVCDGMGGAAAGEVASRMAVDILHEALRRGGAPADRDTLARRLVSAVEESGKRIYDSAQKERSRRGMGTTATAAVLVDKILFIAEVGDSRAYLVRRGQMKQLTKDQSLVNQLIEAGHLTEAEAEAFEHSNIILQALGTAETVQVDLTFVELRKGDRLMMCSDGLSGLVHADMLRETLAGVANPSECGAKLIEYAEAAGGHDNITVVVANFEGDGLEEAKETDTFGYVQYPLPLGADESAAFTDEETTASGMEPSNRVPGAADGMSVLERPSSRTWLTIGGVALALSVSAWFMAESRERPHVAAPQESDVAPVAEEPGPPEAPEPVKAVVVNVSTDVERAILLLNGESRGELVANENRRLELAPGTYKFEAQAEGNLVASMLIDVRGEEPMDVVLNLPSGASQEAAAAPPEQAVPEEALPPPTEVAAPAPEAVPVPTEVAAPAPGALPREPSAAPVALRAPRVPRPPKPRPPVVAAPTAPTAPTAPAVAPPPPPKDIPENPF